MVTTMLIVALFATLLAVLQAAEQYVKIGDSVRYYQHSNDLFFVMEKVDTREQALLWRDLLGVMDKPNIMLPGFKPGPVVEKHLQDLKRKGEVGVVHVWNNINCGAGRAGPTTVEEAMTTFDSENPVELWIAYAWSSSEPPSGPITVEDLMKIEMAVTVTTRAPYLYTWHLGISRNGLWKHAPGVTIHPSISVPLHSFAARVMSQEHPELYYVMSSPEESMQNILIKAFQNQIGRTVFLNWDGMIKVSGQVWRLYTLPDEQSGEQQLIWEGTYEEFHWPRDIGTVGNEFLADIHTLARA